MEFTSFEAFGTHLNRLALMGEAISHHIAEKGAQAIQKDAQDRIGSYQDAIGPFGAWANLAEATVDDRLRKGFTPDDPLERSGELRDSIDRQVVGPEATVGSPLMKALWLDQGTAKIPPRSFLGAAGFNSKKTVGPIAQLTVIAWVCGVGWKRPTIVLNDLPVATHP